jgi:twitching motility protein PilT
LGQREVIGQLVRMQYERNDMDFSRGCFRVRGETIDVFPAEQQPQVRAALADTLEGIVAQELVVNQRGKRSVVCEILFATPAVRSLIREGKTHHVDHVMQTSAGSGMVTRELSLRGLQGRGDIDRSMS